MRYIIIDKKNPRAILLKDLERENREFLIDKLKNFDIISCGRIEISQNTIQCSSDYHFFKRFGSKLDIPIIKKLIR